MGWAIVYGGYEIYPSVIPLRDGALGIVGFAPIAHIYARGDHERPIAEIGSPSETFRDVTEATAYILGRARGVIDGGEAALE